VREHIGCRETGVYGRRYAGRIACSRKAWWLSEFVSVEISGLGNFLGTVDTVYVESFWTSEILRGEDTW
jgi:hypothetical protein